MIKIEADTLQEAFSKAAKELSCSVTEIEIKVIQRPSKGLFGMFKKTAIIEAQREGEKPKSPTKKKSSRKSESTNDKTSSEESQNKRSRNRKTRAKKNQETKEVRQEKPTKHSSDNNKQRPSQSSKPKAPRAEAKKIVPKMPIEEAIPIIKEDVNRLFAQSCFTLDEIDVRAHNDTTVLIEFSGEDAALLIGKEGYRYKSLSYLLYNWVNIRYNLNIRLEIAEFLKNQEESVQKYLVGVIERVNSSGRAQTKMLDGVLVKIALESLRKEFPEKYVGIKTGRGGGKFIVVNDFNKKSS